MWKEGVEEKSIHVPAIGDVLSMIPLSNGILCVMMTNWKR